jgi:hypothetical protein
LTDNGVEVCKRAGRQCKSSLLSPPPRRVSVPETRTHSQSSMFPSSQPSPFHPSSHVTNLHTG